MTIGEAPAPLILRDVDVGYIVRHDRSAGGAPDSMIGGSDMTMGKKLGEQIAVREADKGGEGDVVKLVLVPKGNNTDNYYGHNEEQVWARKVGARDGREVYELQNNAYFHPLIKGDKVTASPDRWSRMQVDGVVKLRKGHTAVAILKEYVRDEVVADHLATSVTHLEGGSGILVGFWKQGTTQLQLERIARDMPTTGVHFKMSSTPRRRKLIDSTMDLNVTGPSEGGEPYTDYWAADDPEWAKAELDDPETMSRVQMLVYEDPMILALIALGLRGNVLAYMDILDTPEPFERPEPGWYLAAQTTDGTVWV